MVTMLNNFTFNLTELKTDSILYFRRNKQMF